MRALLVLCTFALTAAAASIPVVFDLENGEVVSVDDVNLRDFSIFELYWQPKKELNRPLNWRQYTPDMSRTGICLKSS